MITAKSSRAISKPKLGGFSKYSLTHFKFSTLKTSERDEYFGSRPGRRGIFKWTILRKKYLGFKFC